MLNKELQAETKVDREEMSIANSSAQMPQNPMLAEVQLWEHLYGKKVSMNDRFESEHLWSKELAIRNNGRWIPQEVS